MSTRTFWHNPAGATLPRLDGPGTVGVSRKGLLKYVAVRTQTRNPTWPGWSIESVYADLENTKGLWDGDPELLVEMIEELDPQFWEAYPGGEPSLTIKKAQVGEQLKKAYFQGRPRHPRPNLRKTPA